MLARAENDVDFFSRRAMEEARAAAAAKSIAAGAAHRQMAAIYAARLRDEQLAAEGIDDTLGDLSHREIDADATDDGDATDNGGSEANDCDEHADADAPARQERRVAY